MVCNVQLLQGDILFLKNSFLDLQLEMRRLFDLVWTWITELSGSAKTVPGASKSTNK
jgi:hypothetical protein